MRNELAVLMAGFLMIMATPKSSEAEQNWQAPVLTPSLERQFIQPSSDYSAGHRGVDYLVQQNQVVVAPADGVVHFSGRVVSRNVLTLSHGSTILTSFEPVCSRLVRGDKVSRGEIVGRICDEPEYENHCGVRVCLHFSLRTEAGYLSPLVTIGGLSPSRLLPITP
jgi:murein DD-endopeptidase MepM/ murein hydrolase activator NlpD